MGGKRRRRLTGVDEELVGHSWVVHVMNRCCKNGCQDLQISKNRLRVKVTEEQQSFITWPNKIDANAY